MTQTRPAVEARSNGALEQLDKGLLERLAESALIEDGAWQDVTTSATVEPEQRGGVGHEVRGRVDVVVVDPAVPPGQCPPADRIPTR